MNTSPAPSLRKGGAERRAPLGESSSLWAKEDPLLEEPPAKSHSQLSSRHPLYGPCGLLLRLAPQMGQLGGL